MQFLTDFSAVCLVQNLECTRLVSSFALFTAWLPTIFSVYWPIWSVSIIAVTVNPALVPWGLCDPSLLWLTFFFLTFTNTYIAFHVFLRKAFLTMSHTFARFCVFPFIFYLYLFPIVDKWTTLYLPCSIDNFKMQKSQYVHLLLYIRKFLRQSRAYLSLFEYKPVLWNIIWGKEHCNKLCLYSGFFIMGSYWPHGTVKVTFFYGTRSGLNKFDLSKTTYSSLLLASSVLTISADTPPCVSSPYCLEYCAPRIVNVVP